MMRYAHYVLVVTTLACATPSAVTHRASPVTEGGFVADEKVQKIAEGYALDAVDFARDNFGLRLDWSDGSVQHIETILTRFHNEIARAKPSEDEILQFSKMFGSYVGEVFRRNHGARWGMVTVGGATVPGMEANKTGSPLAVGQGAEPFGQRSRGQRLGLLPTLSRARRPWFE